MNEETRVKQQRDLLVDVAMALCEVIPYTGRVEVTGPVAAARARLIEVIAIIKAEWRSR